MMSSARLCLLFALGLCLAGCGVTQDMKNVKINDNLTMARQAATLGKTAEARRWADRAIAVAPNDVSVYAPDLSGYSAFSTDPPEFVHDSVGEVFISAGDDATAVAYLSEAARKFGQSDRPLALLAQAQNRLGDTANARASAKTLASLLEARLARPGVLPSAGLLGELAQAYFDSGDPAKGAATYERVIATYPFSPQTNDARNGLAYSWAVAGDTAHLPQALTLSLQALKAAQSLAKQGRMTDAEVAAVQDTVGWVQFRQGNYSEALLNLHEAMNGDPREAENRYHLGMTYQKLGQTEAARAELSRAVLLSPGYAEAAAALAALPSAPAAPADGA